MAETFYFEIIASDKKFYSGACEHVIFPAVDGLYGVLANHEDTVTAVVAGELRFKVDGEWKVCVVGEGFADVTRDFVVIVVDTVERPEDIDDHELWHYFPEMMRIGAGCRFYNCTHTHEPGCAVREAVERGEVARSRYESYLKIRDEDDKYRK